jgi:hypothetical protein
MAKVMQEQHERARARRQARRQADVRGAQGHAAPRVRVRETLRIYPPLIHLMRMVKEPLQYKDFVIPPGHLVCVSGGMSHAARLDLSRRQDVAPERWFEFPDGAGVPPKHSYLAFGGGRHGCPGEPFAIQQIKTIFSRALAPLRVLVARQARHAAARLHRHGRRPSAASANSLPSKSDSQVVEKARKRTASRRNVVFCCETMSAWGQAGKPVSSNEANIFDNNKCCWTKSWAILCVPSI